jgi:hypothetical protein
MLDLIANIILPAAAVGSTPLAANGYNSSADAAPPRKSQCQHLGAH